MNWFTYEPGVLCITEEITPFAQTAKDLIEAVGSEQMIDLYIDSSGGDSATAFQVYDFLRNRLVTATIRNACSAASLIAMSARKIAIEPAGKIMLHGPSGAVFGTPEEMRARADDLEQSRERLEAVYAERTQKPISVVKAWLAKDSWFDAKQAWTAGLVDEIIEAKQRKAEPELIATAPSLPDDGKSQLLLDLLTALGPIQTSDRASLFREVGFWLRLNVAQSLHPNT